MLRPGAKAFLTKQGEHIVDQKRVSEATIEEFRANGHAYSRHEGHYKDAALVSEGYTRQSMEGIFEILDYTPGGYGMMDVILVQKPRAGTPVQAG